jgi:DivIVA domain-containing protein
MTPAGARAASVTHTDLPPHPPDVRDEEVSHLLAVEFPIGLRGYDRAEVDAYVQRASRVIAELQASRSPQSAVRYALEQVSEETRAILQQAHDTADEVTTRSRAQAAERLEVAEREAAQVRAAAEREAADLRASADRRVQEAEDEVAEIWQERERLIEDARDVAARLAELAGAEAASATTGRPARRFADLLWSTRESWSRRRRSADRDHRRVAAGPARPQPTAVSRLTNPRADPSFPPCW